MHFATAIGLEKVGTQKASEYIRIINNTNIESISGFLFTGSSSIPNVRISENSGIVGAGFDVSGFTGIHSAEDIYVNDNSGIGALTAFNGKTVASVFGHPPVSLCVWVCIL